VPHGQPTAWRWARSWDILVLSCPLSFDGALLDFHVQYVLPNLLEPSIVQYYHELLKEHCSSDKLFPIVRAVSGTEKWRISEPARQKVYVTRFGDRFKAAIPRTCFAEVLLEMPMHMFDVGKRLFPSLNINAKGWHDAKDGERGLSRTVALKDRVCAGLPNAQIDVWVGQRRGLVHL
jgi:hypothetical protein